MVLRDVQSPLSRAVHVQQLPTVGAFSLMERSRISQHIFESTSWFLHDLDRQSTALYGVSVFAACDFIEISEL